MSAKKHYIEISSQELQKRIIAPMALVGVIISFIGFFVNLIIHLDEQVSIVTVFSFIVYLICYYLSNKDKYFVLSRWTILISSLLIINMLWYFNYGSHGPALYLFVIIYSFFIFVFDKKESFILSVIAGANVFTLFYLEYRFPDIVSNYPSDHARILDVYTALVYYSFIFYIFLSIVREAYFAEYKKAKRADQLKSSFLANMSHEIRTPLNAIVGFSNILAEGGIPKDERKHYAEIINGSNKSLLRLVNDILDVSMIESDQLGLKLLPVDLNKLMEHLKETYLLKLKGKPGLTVKYIPTSADHVFITTDSARLQQIMVNLLDNAIKYTEKGKVEFGFNVEDSVVRFFVRDTGIGIKKDHIDYLFDRFYKVEDDNSKLYRGTGIGLYLTKKVVNMLQGEIGVKSDFGKGSEFYFTLPKKEFRIEKEETSIAENKYKFTLIDKSINNTKILIIEDQLSNQQYYEAILKDTNLNIIQAYNGKEGINAFNDNRDVQLILLDIKMPDLDGFEVLKRIKEIDTKVPVVAQTAYAMAGDKERCIEAGFDDYISKPVSKAKLFELISKYCSGSSIT